VCPSRPQVGGYPTLPVLSSHRIAIVPSVASDRYFMVHVHLHRENRTLYRRSVICQELIKVSLVIFVPVLYRSGICQELTKVLVSSANVVMKR